MKESINRYRDILIQIATPYSTGTGFYLKEFDIIVTNEHVIRDNREVIIGGKGFSKRLAKVIYTDLKYDLAFLEAPQDIDMPLSLIHI